MKSQAWVKKDIYRLLMYCLQYQGTAHYLPQVNLDRLNNQNDPQPDGVFDFVEGFTVMSSRAGSSSRCWNHLATTWIMYIRIAGATG